MPPRYKWTQLDFRAEALNHRGQIAGSTYHKGKYEALVWEAGKPARRAGAWISATGGMLTCGGINAAGEVVGNDHARPFRWRQGTFELEYVALPKGERSASFFAINDAGDVLGEAHRPDRKAYLFVWKNKAPAFEVLTSTLMLEPPRLNNRGQIAGSFAGAFAGTEFVPFFWERGRLRELKNLRGCRFTDLNDRGVVAGLEGLQEKQAFLWRSGRRTDIGVRKGDLVQYASVNNREQAVCGSQLWHDGLAHDLRSLIDDLPKSLEAVNAVKINDRGQILCEDNFLLTPK